MKRPENVVEVTPWPHERAAREVAAYAYKVTDSHTDAELFAMIDDVSSTQVPRRTDEEFSDPSYTPIVLEILWRSWVMNLAIYVTARATSRSGRVVRVAYIAGNGYCRWMAYSTLQEKCAEVDGLVCDCGENLYHYGPCSVGGR